MINLNQPFRRGTTVQYNSDIMFRYSLWEKADDLLVKNESGLSIFRRLVDLFIFACAIGVQADKKVDNDITTNDNPIKSISRNTITSNPDLYNLIEFIFQIFVLGSKEFDGFDNERKMRIAFDPDFSEFPNNPVSLLIPYANYGVTEILNCVSENESSTIEDLVNLINRLLSPDDIDVFDIN